MFHFDLAGRFNFKSSITQVVMGYQNTIFEKKNNILVGLFNKQFGDSITFGNNNDTSTGTSNITIGVNNVSTQPSAISIGNQITQLVNPNVVIFKTATQEINISIIDIILDISQVIFNDVGSNLFIGNDNGPVSSIDYQHNYILGSENLNIIPELISVQENNIMGNSNQLENVGSSSNILFGSNNQVSGSGNVVFGNNNTGLIDECILMSDDSVDTTQQINLKDIIKVSKSEVIENLPVSTIDSGLIGLSSVVPYPELVYSTSLDGYQLANTIICDTLQFNTGDPLYNWLITPENSTQLKIKSSTGDSEFILDGEMFDTSLICFTGTHHCYSESNNLRIGDVVSVSGKIENLRPPVVGVSSFEAIPCIQKCHLNNKSKVFGVIVGYNSETQDFRYGNVMHRLCLRKNRYVVASSGECSISVTDENGPVMNGDLLIPSVKHQGRAMKVIGGDTKIFSHTIGKATCDMRPERLGVVGCILYH